MSHECAWTEASRHAKEGRLGSNWGEQGESLLDIALNIHEERTTRERTSSAHICVRTGQGGQDGHWGMTPTGHGAAYHRV